LRRLIGGRRGLREIGKAFADRQTHLMHALPYLGWFVMH
jgi:hypothetical protein